MYIDSSFAYMPMNYDLFTSIYICTYFLYYIGILYTSSIINNNHLLSYVLLPIVKGKFDGKLNRQ